MNDVEKEAVTLEEVLDAPLVEEEEGTSEESEKPKETPEEPEKEKEEEKPSVPYDRFKEINEELKATRQEIRELRTKGKDEGLSEDEKKELAAKEYIEKISRESYEKMVADNATKVKERETEIKESIKFYNSIDKDFTEKVAEEISDKYGAEDNPLSVKVVYNIFKNEKDLKSKIPTLKPKLPNPIRSSETPASVDEKEIRSKGFWELVEDAKKTIRGKE